MRAAGHPHSTNGSSSEAPSSTPHTQHLQHPSLSAIGSETTLHPQFIIPSMAAGASAAATAAISTSSEHFQLAPHDHPPVPATSGSNSGGTLQTTTLGAYSGGRPDYDTKSESRRSRSRASSGSNFSSRSFSTSRSGSSGSRSRSSSSSGEGHLGDRNSGRHRRHSHVDDQLAGPISFPTMLGPVPPDGRMLIPPGATPPPGPTAMMGAGAGLDSYGGRAQFSPQIYAFPPPMMSHQQPPFAGPLGQYGRMLTTVPGIGHDAFGASPGLFTGPRGTIRPGFHAGSRFMVEASAPHLADESLPTFPNAAAAPNRLPAHKPVRLTQPKHPLAPPGTPVYFKYGEEHYPEETVPPEYTFTETDGTVCRYITNFLVYNKRGERLLPIEVLDQPRHAALVLYGSLLPAAAMSQSAARSGRRDNDADLDSLRGRKRVANTSVGGVAKRHIGAGRDGSRRKIDGDRWLLDRGSPSGAITQTYPVRVELAEWCIDYGQEPTNIPFIWLISRWDVYYRLEKPAGRYISTFATAKMKFEVSTRVIKTLQHRPDTSYKTLVDLLTAATRLERSQRKAERRAILKRERKAQRQLALRGVKAEGNEDEPVEEGQSSDITKSLSTDDAYEGKQHEAAGAPGQTKKKNRNWRIQSLSTPQGTGVVVTDEAGRPQALTPWGAPYAVDGFKESMLLGLAEFLESQLRNFMEGVGGTAEAGGCPNLLNTPFMRMLRERTALRMETIQLMEAKRRALEVAKSLAEAASSHQLPSAPALPVEAPPGLCDMSHSMQPGAPDQQHFVPFPVPPGASSGNGYPTSRPPQFFGTEGPTPPQHYFGPGGMGLLGPHNPGMVPGAMSPRDGITALETEIQHLQQLLKDSDDDDDDDDSVSDNENDDDSERDSTGRSHGSYSDNEGGPPQGSNLLARGAGGPTVTGHVSQQSANSGNLYRSGGGPVTGGLQCPPQQRDFHVPPHSPLTHCGQLTENNTPLRAYPNVTDQGGAANFSKAASLVVPNLISSTTHDGRWGGNAEHHKVQEGLTAAWGFTVPPLDENYMPAMVCNGLQDGNRKVLPRLHTPREALLLTPRRHELSSSEELLSDKASVVATPQYSPNLAYHNRQQVTPVG